MIYVLTGNNVHLMDKERAKIRSFYGIDAKDTSFDIVYDYTNAPGMLDRILDDASMPDLFMPHKIIRVLNPSFLTTSKDKSTRKRIDEENKGKGGLTESEEKRFLSYLQDSNPDSSIIFELYKEPIDKRKRIFNKGIKIHGKIIEANNPLDYEIEAQIRNDLKANHVSIDREVIQLLVQRIGTDFERWPNELEKIITHGGKMTSEVIRQLVSRQYFGTGEKDTLNFCNSILRKDMKTVFRNWYDMKAISKEPYVLVSTIASQFRFMYQVAFLRQKGMNNAKIAHELQANAYRVEKTQEGLSLFQMHDISFVLHQIADLDYRVKTGKVDIVTGFEMFLLETTRR